MAAMGEPKISQGANWLGLWTLYTREVRRFIKVYNQTVLAPVVTILIYLAIFALALGETAKTAESLSFLEFLAPGLVAMAIAQNAFANTSSSLIIAKVQGNIVDTLMPPLSANELTCGLALGGMTRGLAVGAVALSIIAFFVRIHIADWRIMLFFGIHAALMLSLLGIIAGIWAEKFDHIASVTNYIIIPLSLLSGTFFSIERLPVLLQHLAHLDPFFYMIDGFRFGVLGHADMSPWIGGIFLTLTNAALWALCYRMFATGYRLKA
ncbi:MAG: ABC transporter permease [Rhodospirillales bacterium]